MNKRESVPLELKSGNICFSRIDWADTTFRITYGRPVTPLIHSLQAIGLQNPPVLQEKEGDRFRIVAGFRRLQALKKMGREPVSGKIAPAGTDRKSLFLFNFHENMDRGFNPVEQSWIVKKLSVLMEERILIQDYLPRLNLPAKKEIFKRYLSTSGISPVYLSALLEGRLFPETIERVNRDFLPIADLIFALFISLHFGFQKQKEFLSDLEEIGKRGLGEPAAFLFSEPVVELLRQINRTPQQKGEALRKYFRSCLYPFLTDMEKAFQKKVSELGLDQRTRLSPPPFFEGGRYGLEIKFSNSKELTESLEKVGQALRDRKLEDLP